MTTQELIEAKARAYDLICVIEQCQESIKQSELVKAMENAQAELKTVNQKIANFKPEETPNTEG